MSDTILAGLITAAVTLVVCLVNNSFNQRKMDLEQDKRTNEIKQEIAIQNVKLEELTREVREHNNFARRMPVVEEKIEVANHRIADLEALEKSRP